MAFVCPNCGYESDHPGDCPECGTTLLKEEANVVEETKGPDIEDEDDDGEW